jgi:hypothetical protein
MKNITALDLISNSIKSEDLYENRFNLGLNKHVQKKYKEKEDSQEKYDLFNNVTSIDDFIKGLRDNGLYVELASSIQRIDYYKVKKSRYTVNALCLVSDNLIDTVIFPSDLYKYILNQEKSNRKLDGLMTQESDSGGMVLKITLDNPMTFDIFSALVDYIENFLNLL